LEFLASRAELEAQSFVTAGLSGYAAGMRFRKSFGLLGWIWVWIACNEVFSWLTGLHPRPLHIASFILTALLVAYQALGRYFIYWDLNSSGIHEWYFGRKKELIPAWGKVLVVRNFLPGMRWDGTVSIYFDNPASKTGFSYFVTTPHQRKDFIAALRRFAPQAKFRI
jgi:hypothetical protein